MDVLPQSSGADGVVAYFGSWPSFHDAEITKLNLERALVVRADDVTLAMEVLVRVFASSYSAETNYEYPLLKSASLAFLFSGAADIELAGFNHQNVVESISAISDEQTDGRIIVAIDPIFGVGGSFSCSAVTVELLQAFRVGG